MKLLFLTHAFNGLAQRLFAELRALGHEVETLGAWDEGVGHAGMLIRHANGVLEGGFDPRSTGAVVALQPFAEDHFGEASRGSRVAGTQANLHALLGAGIGF